MESQVTTIQHKEASWGIFCITDEGDLFIHSDWGFYGYSWRSYGTDTFVEFLASCNKDYIVSKLNHSFYLTCGKRMPKHIQKALLMLVEEFIKYCEGVKSILFKTNI